eukprot:GGOE01002276.1.p3 GENE.GGOE01002276.1~~GGOE01002276.1.p3  ORF type:complete len:196 (-),score=20.53 GGOE01002276.1:523-1110(-)
MLIVQSLNHMKSAFRNHIKSLYLLKLCDTVMFPCLWKGLWKKLFRFLSHVEFLCARSSRFLCLLRRLFRCQSPILSQRLLFEKLFDKFLLHTKLSNQCTMMCQCAMSPAQCQLPVLSALCALLHQWHLHHLASLNHQCLLLHRSFPTQLSFHNHQFWQQLEERQHRSHCTVFSKRMPPICRFRWILFKNQWCNRL